LRQTALGSPQLYSQLGKTVYSAERSDRIMQPATGLLVSGTTSGRPASRHQRRKSLSRRAGDETAVAEPHWTTHVLVKKPQRLAAVGPPG